MKASSKTIIFVLIGLIIGFVLGMEYKSYQIRSAVQEGLDGISEAFNTGEGSSESEDIPEEEEVIVEKAIGDEVELATVKFKVNSAEETDTLTAPYSQPTTASENTKFVVIDLDLTNTTKEPYAYYDYDFFSLIDQDKNSYNAFNSISVIDNYLDTRELAPQIAENGKIVFELPKTSTSYSLSIGKAGTNETYHVKLK